MCLIHAGFMITFAIAIVNYSIVDKVPLGFLYLESVPYILGGYPIYYLGMYGFGASNVSLKSRYVVSNDPNWLALQQYRNHNSIAELIALQFLMELRVLLE